MAEFVESIGIAMIMLGSVALIGGILQFIRALKD